MTSTTQTTQQIYQIIQTKVCTVQDLRGKVLDLEKEIETLWPIYWKKRDEDAEATAKAEAAAAEKQRVASLRAQIHDLEAQLIAPRQYGYPLNSAPDPDFYLEARSEYMSVSSEGSTEIDSEGGLWTAQAEYHAAALSGAKIQATYNAAAQHPHADEGDYLLHTQNMRAALVEDTSNDEKFARQLAGQHPQDYKRPQAGPEEMTWQQEELLEQHEEHDPRPPLAAFFPQHVPQSQAVSQSVDEPLTNLGPCPGPCKNNILFHAKYYGEMGFNRPKRCADCKAFYASFALCVAAGNTQNTRQLLAQRPIKGNGLKTGPRSFDLLGEYSEQ